MARFLAQLKALLLLGDDGRASCWSAGAPWCVIHCVCVCVWWCGGVVVMLGVGGCMDGDARVFGLRQVCVRAAPFLFMGLLQHCLGGSSIPVAE